MASRDYIGLRWHTTSTLSLCVCARRGKVEGKKGKREAEGMEEEWRLLARSREKEGAVAKEGKGRMTRRTHPPPSPLLTTMPSSCCTTTTGSPRPPLSPPCTHTHRGRGREGGGGHWRPPPPPPSTYTHSNTERAVGGEETGQGRRRLSASSAAPVPTSFTSMICKDAQREGGRRMGQRRSPASSVVCTHTHRKRRRRTEVEFAGLILHRHRSALLLALCRPPPPLSRPTATDTALTSVASASLFLLPALRTRRERGREGRGENYLGDGVERERTEVACHLGPI